MQAARLEAKKLRSGLSPAAEFWLTNSSFVLPFGRFIVQGFEKYQLSDYMFEQSNVR